MPEFWLAGRERKGAANICLALWKLRGSMFFLVCFAAKRPGASEAAYPEDPAKFLEDEGGNQSDQLSNAEENSKLRHVEKDVLIPQIMRERAKELCSDEVRAFTKCCQETGLLMVVKCRQENTALKDCLVGYYSDPLFYEECKTEYLKQREEYRATGIKKKRQKLTSNV